MMYHLARAENVLWWCYDAILALPLCQGQDWRRRMTGHWSVGRVVWAKNEDGWMLEAYIGFQTVPIKHFLFLVICTYQFQAHTLSISKQLSTQITQHVWHLQANRERRSSQRWTTRSVSLTRKEYIILTSLQIKDWTMSSPAERSTLLKLDEKVVKLVVAVVTTADLLAAAVQVQVQVAVVNSLVVKLTQSRLAERVVNPPTKPAYKIQEETTCS